MGKKEIKPLVSIGMPVYNGENYINRALDSLLAQSYDYFKLTISDNASTDFTGKICEEYAKNDERINYVRQNENIGATLNFIYVLEQAKGEYFMWAAHYDEWEPNFIESLIEILENHKNVSIAQCQTIYKLKSDNKDNKFPAFLQGIPLNSPFPRSYRRRINIAVNENYGELFYGIYRKSSLISDDNEIGAVNFEKDGVIHAGLKAMLNGDVYVSRDFYFIKTVSLDAFLWTYLCAKRKSPLAMNVNIENMLKDFQYNKKNININSISEQIWHYRRIFRIFFRSDNFQKQYFLAAIKTINNLNISHGKRILFLRIRMYLLRDAIWTKVTYIKKGFV